MTHTEYQAKLAGFARDALCDARRWHDKVELYEAAALNDPHAAELYKLAARGESLARDHANRIRIAAEAAEFVGCNVLGIGIHEGGRMIGERFRREQAAPISEALRPESTRQPGERPVNDVSDSLHDAPPRAA